MKIIKKLYVSESAKKEKRKILRGLEKKELQPFVYVITYSTGGGILDILPAYALKYPFYYTGKTSELEIVGIAKGRQEALELTARIAEDTYNAGGDFDVRAYITSRT